MISFPCTFRQDTFREFEIKVPRTLAEYVLASQALNGTDLNGDGEPDFGARERRTSEYFLIWIAQTLQYRGISQGSFLDTDTLTPLLENPVGQEAMKLWKQVAGPPEMTDDPGFLWTTGRCANDDLRIICVHTAPDPSLRWNHWNRNHARVREGVVEGKEGDGCVQHVVLPSCHGVPGWSGGEPCSIRFFIIRRRGQRPDREGTAVGSVHLLDVAHEGRQRCRGGCKWDLCWELWVHLCEAHAL